MWRVHLEMGWVDGKSEQTSAVIGRRFLKEAIDQVAAQILEYFVTHPAEDLRVEGRRVLSMRMHASHGASPTDSSQEPPKTVWSRRQTK